MPADSSTFRFRRVQFTVDQDLDSVFAVRLQLEGLGEYEGETGPRDKWTTKLFGGWQKGPDAAGVEAFRRVNAAAGVAGADVIPVGVSAFAHRRLNDHWRAVGRVDWFDPDHERSNAGYREMDWIAALDAMRHPNVHLMPNVLVRSYSAKDAALPDRKADVTLRVTLHWIYK